MFVSSTIRFHTQLLVKDIPEFRNGITFSARENMMLYLEKLKLWVVCVCVCMCARGCVSVCTCVQKQNQKVMYKNGKKIKIAERREGYRLVGTER